MHDDRTSRGACSEIIGDISAVARIEHLSRTRAVRTEIVVETDQGDLGEMCLQPVEHVRSVIEERGFASRETPTQMFSHRLLAAIVVFEYRDDHVSSLPEGA